MNLRNYLLVKTADIASSMLREGRNLNKAKKDKANKEKSPFGYGKDNILKPLSMRYVKDPLSWNEDGSLKPENSLAEIRAEIEAKQDFYNKRNKWLRTETEKKDKERSRGRTWGEWWNGENKPPVRENGKVYMPDSDLFYEPYPQDIVGRAKIDYNKHWNPFMALGPDYEKTYRENGPLFIPGVDIESPDIEGFGPPAPSRKARDEREDIVSGAHFSKMQGAGTMRKNKTVGSK